MTQRGNRRALIASAAIAAALTLGGCKTDGMYGIASKAGAPLSPVLISEMEQKNMAKESPILVRLFKEEAELEVWKQDRTGRYALLKTYPICRWSGELGPKVKEGDRQAPEGFYAITPAQMNPNSAYYLSFNIGYPNAYDQAWGRTGSQLMVHGDCSSRGCYAMTDEQISEIFALGRESFFGGQQAFQVQAYPFRMTAQNMAKHRNNPNIAFWKMLKRGNDHFEVTRLEPKVDVCEKRYVFDAEAPPNASRALSFSPAGKCPAYVVPQEVADAVNDKQRKDELQTAQLIAKGSPTAPVKTFADGGMNPVFMEALNKQAGRDSTGQVALVAPIKTDLGTIPTSVNPPRVVEPKPEPAPVVAVAAAPATQAPAAVAQKPSLMQRMGSLFKPSEPAPRPVAEVEQTASADQTKPAKPGMIKRMFGAKDTHEAKPADAKTASKPSLRGTDTAYSEEPAAHKTASPWPAAPSNGAIRPPQRVADESQGRPAAQSTTSNNGSLMSGSQAIVPASSFDSRFSAFR